MCSDLRSEDILGRVKEELNREKIKLWLDPYYDENNGVGTDQEQALQLLCKQIVEKLNIDEDQCLSSLRELQNNSLDRLKSNQVFKDTGVANLKIRMSGDVPMNLKLNILLTVTTEALIQEIATATDLPTSRIKLISGGKVLKVSETLVAQGIKNGMQLMAVILAADSGKLQEAEKRFKTLESTKKDVQLLAGRSNVNNEYYLQVENQAGETMNLPYHERKALVTAMALHEKGRAALKKEDYSLALVLFLEADKEYSECTSELLKAVDNYALLHLDIAWCYLCLRNPAQIPNADRRLGLCEQNFHRSYGPNLDVVIEHLLMTDVHISHECTSELLKAVDNYALLHLDIAWCYLCLRNPAQIPDADRRLGLCEQNFHRSYGPNLERLISIKGTTGSEAALFMRLHLLQGVVAFHQNKRPQARALLERAQHELNGLKVDDKSLVLLMELGYSSSEARIALRSTQGNIELAEDFIHRRRNERESVRERNRLKLQNERERIALGLCADKKQYCDPEFVKRLVTMGFDRQQSIAALKLANNVLGEAISILQDQPHLLASSSRTASQELVAQVVSLGLSPEVAREALLRVPQLEEAVEALNNLSRVIGAGANEAQAAASASVAILLEEFRNKRKKREDEEQQAFERVSEDLIGNDLTDDHLDLNLAQEEQFLIEYLSLLN